ncbi:MAG: class I SAM-dependent methyltransferase [Nitrospinae bacterium]|nr:class I SAM-dependent methyltransferase [Nitrospinota bacterium]
MKGFYSRHLFPRLLELFMDRPLFSVHRAGLLAGVTGDTLELGAGPGLNFPHYPGAVRRLTAIDHNEGMREKARRRAKEAGLDVAYRILDGAHLPFPDGSFDTVVSSWTLCSVDDIEGALAQVRRVLKPAGRFLFLEHGRSADVRVARWQRRLTPFNRIVADGCRLDRDIPALLTGAGFDLGPLSVFPLQGAPSIFATHYQGVATL